MGGKLMGAKDGGGREGPGAAGGGSAGVVMSENGLFSGGLTWGTGFIIDVPTFKISNSLITHLCQR